LFEAAGQINRTLAAKLQAQRRQQSLKETAASVKKTDGGESMMICMEVAF
jgi:hypothetical protein